MVMSDSVAGEEQLRKDKRGFRLPDARRAAQHEHPDWLRGIVQFRTAGLDSLGDRVHRMVLTDHALLQLVADRQHALDLVFDHPANGNAGPVPDDRSHGILIDHAETIGESPWIDASCWIARSRPSLRAASLPRIQILATARIGQGPPGGRQLLERFLLLRPLRFDRFALRARRSELGVELLEAVVHAILFILLALHDLPFDLEQLDPAPSVFDLRRQSNAGRPRRARRRCRAGSPPCREAGAPARSVATA